MELCSYAKYIKCTSCDKVFYKQCPKFLLARATYLTRSLRPFVYDKSVKVTENVVWSKNPHKAKSACVKFSLKTSSEVKKYTLNQVLSTALNGNDVEGKVFYIDYGQKATGDPDKVKGVLVSFIDSVILNGGYVSVFVGNGVVCQLDYQKL